MNKPRIFLGFIVVLTLITFSISWRSPLARAIRGEEAIFGLLVGTDLTDHSRHADTIILARYSPATRSLDLLSIPRDTKVSLPGTKIKRINEVYTYAFRTSKSHDFACQKLSRVIEQLLFSDPYSTAPPPTTHSVADQKIHFYAQVDYDGFRKVVDILGGVPVTIDESMHYDDKGGNLSIHFEPGKSTLGGEKALEYIRFRGLSGDFGRTLRQQEFLLNLINRLKNPIHVLKLSQIIQISLPTIKMNLNGLERLLVLSEIKDLPKNRIRLIQLPGRPSPGGFWIPDTDGVRATASLLTASKKSGEAIRDPQLEEKNLSKEKEEKKLIRSETTVEVWNASDKKGVALEVVHKLRNSGFDVVKWGNYLSRQRRTLVRDHKGDSEQARAIADALQSPRVEVFTRLETDPLVDIEVIIGEDYETGK